VEEYSNMVKNKINIIARRGYPACHASMNNKSNKAIQTKHDDELQRRKEELVKINYPQKFIYK